jgi:hypothetical protein
MVEEPVEGGVEGDGFNFAFHLGYIIIRKHLALIFTTRNYFVYIHL